MKIRVLNNPEVVESSMWYNASVGLIFEVADDSEDWWLVVEDYKDFKYKIFNTVYNGSRGRPASHHFIKKEHAIDITKEDHFDKELFEI